MTEEDAFATLNEIVDYVLKVNISWEIGVWVAGRAFINGTEMMDAKEGYQAYPKNGEWTIKDPYTDDILGVPFITVPSGATLCQSDARMPRLFCQLQAGDSCVVWRKVVQSACRLCPQLLLRESDL